MEFVLQYAGIIIPVLFVLGVVLAMAEHGFLAVVAFILTGYVYSTQDAFTFSGLLSNMFNATMHWIATNGIYAVAAVIIYPALGVVASRFLWIRDVQEQQDKYLDYKKRTLEKHNVKELDELSADVLEDFKSYAKNHFEVLNPLDHKTLIISRIAWWPAYMLHYMFFDIVRDLAVRAYRKVSNMFVRISEKHSAEYMADMKVTTSKEKAERYVHQR